MKNTEALRPLCPFMLRIMLCFIYLVQSVLITEVIEVHLEVLD